MPLGIAALHKCICKLAAGCDGYMQAVQQDALEAFPAFPALVRLAAAAIALCCFRFFCVEDFRGHRRANLLSFFRNVAMVTSSAASFHVFQASSAASSFCTLAIDSRMSPSVSASVLFSYSSQSSRKKDASSARDTSGSVSIDAYANLLLTSSATQLFTVSGETSCALDCISRDGSRSAPESHCRKIHSRKAHQEFPPSLPLSAVSSPVKMDGKNLLSSKF